MTELLVSLTVERLEEGLYLATSPDLPGLIVEGHTIREIIEIAQDVARVLIESYVEHGDPLPPTLRSSPATIEIAVPVAAA